MTPRIPRALAALLIVVLLGATGTGLQRTDPFTFPPDFPQPDSRIWTLQQTGLIRELAAAAVARMPDSAETFELLVKAQRPIDALSALERIVDKRPDEVSRAVRTMSELASQLARSEFREHADRLRALVTPLRSRIAQLPREDEAQAARYLLSVEAALGRRGSAVWADLIERYVRDYAGTNAARIAEVEAIAARPLNPGRLAELE